MFAPGRTRLASTSDYTAYPDVEIIDPVTPAPRPDLPPTYSGPNQPDVPGEDDWREDTPDEDLDRDDIDSSQSHSLQRVRLLRTVPSAVVSVGNGVAAHRPVFQGSTVNSDDLNFDNRWFNVQTTGLNNPREVAVKSDGTAYVIDAEGLKTSTDGSTFTAVSMGNTDPVQPISLSFFLSEGEECLAVLTIDNVLYYSDTAQEVFTRIALADVAAASSFDVPVQAICVRALGGVLGVLVNDTTSHRVIYSDAPEAPEKWVSAGFGDDGSSVLRVMGGDLAYELPGTGGDAALLPFFHGDLSAADKGKWQYEPDSNAHSPLDPDGILSAADPGSPFEARNGAPVPYPDSTDAARVVGLFSAKTIGVPAKAGIRMINQDWNVADQNFSIADEGQWYATNDSGTLTVEGVSSSIITLGRDQKIEGTEVIVLGGAKVGDRPVYIKYTNIRNDFEDPGDYLIMRSNKTFSFISDRTDSDSSLYGIIAMDISFFYEDNDEPALISGSFYINNLSDFFREGYGLECADGSAILRADTGYTLTPVPAGMMSIISHYRKINSNGGDRAVWIDMEKSSGFRMLLDLRHGTVNYGFRVSETKDAVATLDMNGKIFQGYPVSGSANTSVPLISKPDDTGDIGLQAVTLTYYGGDNAPLTLAERVNLEADSTITMPVTVSRTQIGELVETNDIHSTPDAFSQISVNAPVGALDEYGDFVLGHYAELSLNGSSGIEFSDVSLRYVARNETKAAGDLMVGGDGLTLIHSSDLKTFEPIEISGGVSDASVLFLSFNNVMKVGLSKASERDKSAVYYSQADGALKVYDLPGIPSCIGIDRVAGEDFLRTADPAQAVFEISRTDDHSVDLGFISRGTFEVFFPQKPVEVEVISTFEGTIQQIEQNGAEEWVIRFLNGNKKPLAHAYKNGIELIEYVRTV
jgi:hypothetical protein